MAPVQGEVTLYNPLKDGARDHFGDDVCRTRVLAHETAVNSLTNVLASTVSQRQKDSFLASSSRKHRHSPQHGAHRGHARPAAEAGRPAPFTWGWGSPASQPAWPGSQRPAPGRAVPEHRAWAGRGVARPRGLWETESWLWDVRQCDPVLRSVPRARAASGRETDSGTGSGPCEQSQGGRPSTALASGNESEKRCVPTFVSFIPSAPLRRRLASLGIN